VDPIKENHERRMARLAEMIDERHQRMADHKSGRRRLTEDEFHRTARQVENFQRKLDSMVARNTDAVRV
jgi:hypothetical protein